MEDLSQRQSYGDQLNEIEYENKKLKDKIQALEKENGRMNKLLKRIFSLAETADAQDDHLTPLHCHSPAELVVSDSSKRTKSQNLEFAAIRQHDRQTDSISNAEGKCAPLKFTTLSWSEQMKREIRNFEDEQRLRHLLCNAIAKHASYLAPDGFGLQASDFPDRLVGRNCITEEECNQLLNSSNKSINQMRIVLGLVLRRDCYTLLSFIDELFKYNEYRANEITKTYECLSQQDDLLEMQDLNCSHCLLRERVEPVLIIDQLIGHDYMKWLPFYEQVTRCDNVPEKRNVLWDTFMTLVNKENASAEVMPLVIEGLQAYKFHSDIEKKLHDDHTKGINSFKCRHKGLPEETLKCSNDVKSDISEPKMHELKLADIEDAENTNLKQVFCPRIQNGSADGTDNRMQELKLFELKSEEETIGRYGHKTDQHTNEGKQNGSENPSCTILFVKDSNITIVKKKD